MRDSQGSTGTHHVTYELHLHDGRILRTRISHPPDRSTYGKSIWANILRDQLDVSEAEFWACVQDKVKPDRGEPRVPAEALPAELVHLLITRLGLSDAEIAKMSKADAIARMQEYWSRPPEGDAAH
ncbi:MAG TPA: cytotoxic translational repressor of toxin-antitoxin stability system [Streptosporangiaceae bacterium]